MKPEEVQNAEYRKKHSRSKILIALYKKPRSFSELLVETRLSRATLSQHLKTMLKEGKIERTWNNQRLYQAIKDEKHVLEALKETFSLYEVIAFTEGDEEADVFFERMTKNFMKNKPIFEGVFPKSQDIKESEEHLYCFTKEQLEQLRAKYPDAIKELLGEVDVK